VLVDWDVYPPVWVDSEWAGINQSNCQKAIKAGLVFRPLADTICDTLAWHNTRPADYELKSGIKPEQEQKLLQAWHQQNNRK